ncbi:MAG: electron transfer flavoprotein subunit beta/FixA family protein [Candidatus Brocadiia bacterium]
MPYKIVVCIKQVPDTENLTSKAMKEDGTVNRSALPAIVNPEDLNALEMALQIKEEHGANVTVITMGPPSATEALREALYRGADHVILLTDRKFAASDTLATSYILSQGVRQTGQPDLVLCGRQAIDGDTAQIGPQLAEKLQYPQCTYADEILNLTKDTIKVRRNLGQGYEILESPLPALLTVTEEANEPRPPAAKKLMVHKKSQALCELEKSDDSEEDTEPTIDQWGAEDIDCDLDRCGRSGSPTKVKKIESVQLVSEEHARIKPSLEGLSGLVRELIDEHIIE